jgi:DNA-directed RNA polymerase specialized sigma24 family protein
MLVGGLAGAMPGASRPPQGDEAELFLSFNAELQRKIATKVATSPQIIEDACAFAWMEFLRYQPDRAREWKGWLFVTAQREAWRLDRERRSTMTLDMPIGERGLPRDPRDPRSPHDQALDLLATVEMLDQLPPRLRRIAFLRGVGLRYSEITEITGDSPGRIGVLVTRTNDRIRRSLDAERDRERDLPPRARRLRELEDAPAPMARSAPHPRPARLELRSRRRSSRPTLRPAMRPRGSPIRP